MDVKIKKWPNGLYSVITPMFTGGGSLEKLKKLVISFGYNPIVEE